MPSHYTVGNWRYLQTVDLLMYQAFGDLGALQRMLSQAGAAAAAPAAGPGLLPAIWRGAMAAPGPTAPAFSAPSAQPTHGPALSGNLASLGGQLAALAALNPGLLRALACAPQLQAGAAAGQDMPPAQAPGSQGPGPAAAGGAGQAAGGAGPAAVPRFPGWPLPGGPGPPANGGASQ